MPAENTNARLLTFCDGVFAIAITLLILDIKVPAISSIHSITDFWHKLAAEWPSWFGFSLSFMIIFIDWNNHHIGSKFINKSSARFIFANGFLLFAVVILPFATGLMSAYFFTPYAQPAITFYCFCLLIHSVAWIIMVHTILHPVPLTKDEEARKHIKGTFKLLVYGAGFFLAMVILSFWFPYTAMILITATWIFWLLIGIVMDRKNQKEKI